jgi:hypothetical protein
MDRITLQNEDEINALTHKIIGCPRRLFGRDVKTMGKHITNIPKEELRSISVVANCATTASDGNNPCSSGYTQSRRRLDGPEISGCNSVLLIGDFQSPKRNAGYVDNPEQVIPSPWWLVSFLPGTHHKNA